MPSSSSSRLGSAIFRSKAIALQTGRAFHDRRDGICAHSQREIPSSWKQLYEIRSPLWNDAGEVDAELERGKVQNLRAAVRRLDGAHVEANSVFSFWAQIGRATRRRGFVAGRLLREGCLMPAVGGGLCQLSNALYELALQAGLEVLERHAHSRVVEGSAAKLGRDATVAWNYVDLRFHGSQPFVVRAFLTRDELVVALWGDAPVVEEKRGSDSFQPLVLFDSRPSLVALAHSCATCGDTGCFRYDARPRRSPGQCAWLVDEAWPEWKALACNWDGKKSLLAPRPEMWPSDGWEEIQGARICALKRSVQTRFARTDNPGGSVWRTQLEMSEHVARALEKRLSSEVTHVVVAQSLLPFLWQSGALGGRTFDVLMTRTPFKELAERLDGAYAALGDCTLSDFRAPSVLVQAEQEALDAARTLYSPHECLAEMMGRRVQKIDWAMPSVTSPTKNGRRDAVVLAGAALARKGAYAVRDAVSELGVPLIIAGRDWMPLGFWDGVDVRQLDAKELWEEHARVVVLPALVEHAPRSLLRALAQNIPVVATRECGLGERDSVATVPFGDAEALIKALRVFF